MQSAQPPLDPWDDDGTKYPGNHFQALEGQEGNCEQPIWILKGQLRLYQPSTMKLLAW